MPTICNFETCRNKAVYGFEYIRPVFCSTHREPNMKNVRFITPIIVEPKPKKICKLCSGKISPRYKEYCSDCYVKQFPFDPLSLQTKYKSKKHVIRKFIDSRFDGFIHENECSKIKINDAWIYVVFTEIPATSSVAIIIKFNPDKYENEDGSYSNPLLYTRLPMLEREISKQIERIMSKVSRENIETIEMNVGKLLQR